MSLYGLLSHTAKPTKNLHASVQYVLCSKLLTSSSESVHPAKRLFDRFASKLNDKLILLGEILTVQCHVYAAQRIRRLTQIGSLYRNIYNEKSIENMVARFARRLQRKQTLGFLLGAVLFNWKQEKISSEEMVNCIDEFDRLVDHSNKSGFANNGNYNDNKGNVQQLKNEEKKWNAQQLRQSGWEPVIAKPNLQVWRKSVPKSYLYEYKVFGSFHDIPARAFFSVQTDTEYRKKWDKLVIKLDVIDKDEQDGCEVVHWVMHYPYPMYSRDYVYVRKSMIDVENRVMVLVSRSIEHPSVPTDKKYVRVQKYFSQMVIRPHRHFDDTGFDYVLTYFDDPEAAFPSPAYNWMASTGVPDFVEKLHNAAYQLYLQRRAASTSNLNLQDISQNCNFHPVYS